jgi:ADP-ribosylglycohydrolase
LFGLAYGDSLGRFTEFWPVERIEQVYGPGGPTELTGEPALVTDDTQMALALAWAIMDAGEVTPRALAQPLRDRFVAWLQSPDNNRAPGNTCMHACLALSEGAAWLDASVLESKGCGANMRVTPIGLLPGLDLATMAGAAQFQSAFTHGHPTALAASELTAYATRLLRDGEPIVDAAAQLRERCDSQREVYREDWLGDLWERSHAASPKEFISRGWDECRQAVDAVWAALAGADPAADPCLATGAGWVAEEALATGLYCAMLFPDDPVAALGRAANSSGDSDSIACLTGAFLGAAHGMAVWPRHWREQIEYADQLAELGAAWD